MGECLKYSKLKIKKWKEFSWKINLKPNKMLTQIIWLLTWPMLIAVSYVAIKWMLKKFERNAGN
jgi:hypothetical protein